jgi:hypothetical protein
MHIIQHTLLTAGKAGKGHCHLSTVWCVSKWHVCWLDFQSQLVLASRRWCVRERESVCVCVCVCVCVYWEKKHSAHRSSLCWLQAYLVPHLRAWCLVFNKCFWNGLGGKSYLKTRDSENSIHYSPLLYQLSYWRIHKNRDSELGVFSWSFQELEIWIICN